MLDYREKIKEHEYEIEQMKLDVAKLSLERQMIIDKYGLQLTNAGQLSIRNDREAEAYISAMEIGKQISQLKGRIASKHEAIEKLDWLIRESLMDSLFMYEPDYYLDVISTNGSIKGHRF